MNIPNNSKYLKKCKNMYNTPKKGVQKGKKDPKKSFETEFLEKMC